VKILVAPDKFAGTLTAREAAQAIATGWHSTRPDDELSLLPMSDGGPGFVDAVGPGDGHQVHLESASYIGHQHGPDPWHASTFSVGTAVRDAIAAGARRVVIGLGGSRTNDGGAGFLAGLGADADVQLDAGPEGLRGVTAVDLAAARKTLEGIELVAAADVDVPLLGLFGATKTFGEQKGLGEEDLLVVDHILDRFVDAVCGGTPAERRIAETPGAGAAGGLGFAILALGGTVVRGVEFVAEWVRLADAARSVDLVVTGEGTYDHSSRSGKVAWGVAAAAQESARPCIVLAGQVTVGQREMRAMGIESAYSMVDLAGFDLSLARPALTLADLAARVARTWSR
jgi:glycerate kinase